MAVRGGGQTAFLMQTLIQPSRLGGREQGWWEASRRRLPWALAQKARDGSRGSSGPCGTPGSDQLAERGVV